MPSDCLPVKKLLTVETSLFLSTLGSIEHRAQVILYTLLMSDRYSQAIDAGLLFYLKSSHMLSVPGFLHEKRALVMKRNEVARYLTLNRAGTTGTMPGRSIYLCFQVCVLNGRGNGFMYRTYHIKRLSYDLEKSVPNLFHGPMFGKIKTKASQR